MCGGLVFESSSLTRQTGVALKASIFNDALSDLLSTVLSSSVFIGMVNHRHDLYSRMVCVIVFFIVVCTFA